MENYNLTELDHQETVEIKGGSEFSESVFELAGNIWGFIKAVSKSAKPYPGERNNHHM
jgi:hypothetical protein